MKRGGYDLAHYSIYFLVVALFLGIIISSLYVYERKSYYQSIREVEAVQQYVSKVSLQSLFDRCFAQRTFSDSFLLGTFSLTLFTDEHLRSCTSKSLRFSLSRPDEPGKRVIATQEALKTRQDLQRVYEESVLIDGNSYHLLVEEPYA